MLPGNMCSRTGIGMGMGMPFLEIGFVGSSGVDYNLYIYNI